MFDRVRWTVREASMAISPLIVKAVESGSLAEDGPAMSSTYRASRRDSYRRRSRREAPVGVER